MRTAIQTLPSREADKFVVRLPEGMRERISVVAKSNGRSMNNEIVIRLHLSLMDDEEPEEGYTEKQAQQAIIKALTLRTLLLDKYIQAMPENAAGAEFKAWRAKLETLMASHG